MKSKRLKWLSDIRIQQGAQTDGHSGVKIFETSCINPVGYALYVYPCILDLYPHTFFYNHLLLLVEAGQSDKHWNLTGLVSILVKMESKCHFSFLFFFLYSLTHPLIFPPSSSFFQTLLVLSSLSAIALVISLLVVLSFLIHYCCCHRGDRNEGSEEEEEDEDGSTGHGYSGKKGRGICCVTWVAVAAVTLCWWERVFRRHCTSWQMYTRRLLAVVEEVFRCFSQTEPITLISGSLFFIYRLLQSQFASVTAQTNIYQKLGLGAALQFILSLKK